jgi:acyl-coenzyme A synthetase/AMP-(fatty) acid ligase
VLLSHPHIIDAAVIGVRKPGVEDEFPRAYVVRRPGTEGSLLTEEKVGESCSRELASYKRLTGGVRFMDSIPKNPTGKVLKRVLRDMSYAENKSRL